MRPEDIAAHLLWLARTGQAATLRRIARSATDAIRLVTLTDAAAVAPTAARLAAVRELEDAISDRLVTP